jgi:hypothetical protein
MCISWNVGRSQRAQHSSSTTAPRVREIQSLQDVGGDSP